MLREPNYRLRAVERAIANGHDLVDPREQALGALLRGNACPDDTVLRAHDIYINLHKRETIEALLLVECTSEEIEVITKVSAKAVTAYAYLFFDSEVFEDDLDRIAYSEEYNQSDFGKELKQYGMTVGKDGLLVRISRGAHVVPPSETHKSIRNTAFMLSQMAKMNPLNSALTREAFRWAQLCMRASENAPDANAGNPVLDLEISIRSVDALRSADDEDDENGAALKPEDISRGD